MKYGKKPARPGAVKLKFGDYANVAALPDPPDDFGHERMVNKWGVLFNDRIGDCAIAGALHETLLWNVEAGKRIELEDPDAPPERQPVVLNYSAVTGYQPGPELANPADAPENPSDNGTDVAALCTFRRTTGLVDAAGDRHLIGAYVALEPGNFEQLKYATYYFDGVGVGIEVPDVYQQWFAEGRPWDAVSDPNIEGGHYITSVAWRDGMPVMVTWGLTHPMTQAGYEQFNDETYAYLTVEKLRQGIDMQGLQLAQLDADIRMLTAVG